MSDERGTLSPDGSIRLGLSGVEMRLSHWVMSPRFTHVPSGFVLNDLDGA